jgi:amino acid permease
MGNEEYQLSVLIMKVIAMVIFFVLSFVTCYVPLWNKEHALNKKYFSYSRVFSKGIFLATSVLFFMPQNVEIIYEQL